MQMHIRAAKPTTNYRRGFTLIEVMIVVAIIAVLAAFAIPQYREYVLRGQLVSATNLLSSYQARMERHFQDNRDYRTVGAFITPCVAAAAERDEFFQLSCPTLEANSFVLRATGRTGLPTAGFQFTVDQQSARSTVAPTGWGDCATRWILRRGQACN